MRFYKITYLVIYFLFFCTNVHTTSHYIDKNAKGNNSGNSWRNAWKSFSDIKWSKIQPGDTLFISGGSDSTIYYETFTVGASGSANNPITIRNSYDNGHNGRVIIDGGNNTRTESIYLNQYDYLYFKGLELRRATRGIKIHRASEVITLDSLIIYDFYGQSGINIIGNNNPADGSCADSITIKNCSIVSFTNVDGQTDCIYAQDAARITVHDNFIWERNSSLINNHSDAIQSYRTRGWKIYNNVVIADSGAQGMALILGAWETDEDGYSDSVIVYNNYFYMGGLWFEDAPWVASVCTRWYPSKGQSKPPTVFIHNTIVTKGPYVEGFRFEYPARLYNNIIAQYGAGTPYTWTATLRNSSGGAIDVDNITNSVIWRDWGDISCTGTYSNYGKSLSNFGWTTWRSTLGGTGINSDPLFVNDFNTENAYVISANSPAIGRGKDVQSIVELMGFEWKDIEGNERDSSPDIGAYQYVP